ncbi:MAG: glycosyltransferase, partial [Planctomycetes bacterium]|nr:glycosyltransferase [Planctomycetota bacterium]
MRGGERCLEVLCDLIPRATIYTLFRARGRLSPRIEGMRIRVSSLGRLPGATRIRRWLLPLYPRAIERLRIAPCDLVVSLSHCVAKSAIAPRGAAHVCYCFTPMRYAWGEREAYLRGGAARRMRGIARPVLDRLARWDRETARRPDRYIAISRTVAGRIRRLYGLSSEVVYPPVDCARFRPGPRERKGPYAIVSALVPYKRIDLAIETFERIGRPLLVAGDGPEAGRLRRLARRHARLLGPIPDADVAALLAEARAFVMPGEEDFGIAPLEAMASGTPVIALARGGAVETVIPPGGREPPTGLLFEAPDVESLARAIGDFERIEGIFAPEAIRR